MIAKPRQVWLLAGLFAVLIGLVFYNVRSPARAVSPNGAGARPSRGTTPARKAAPPPEVVDVDLARLDVAGPPPGTTGRNPFRMGAAAAAPSTATAAPVTPPPAESAVPAGPPPPPPLPPIPYKFIGIVTAQGRLGRIAVLSDGRAVVHGREGEIVDGRFRIVRIGVESIQMEYADGRGRQTIRLTGS